MKNCTKKKIMAVVFAFMIIQSIEVKAVFKTVTLLTSKKTASCSCMASVAKAQGGAMQGGNKGIRYKLYFTSSDNLETVIAIGIRKPNKSFKTNAFNSPVGYQETLTLKLSQVDANDPCLGWGRIDYNQ